MKTTAQIIHADCLDWTRTQPDKSVDLVVCSPPYEDARTYGIAFKLRGQDWVDWAVDRFIDQVRICRGLVIWVIEGKTKDFRWSATPALFMADLHRRGIQLRKPPIYQRVGIPGSGGPDWWRNDYEFCVCGTSGGKLPWSDNTATGQPPKFAPGGAMSYRHADGIRKNARGYSAKNGRDEYGFTPHDGEPSQTQRANGAKRRLSRGNEKGSVAYKMQTRRKANGARPQDGEYAPPALANPGNVIRCKVGGGLMGSDLAHENEAPFPEALVEPFVLCFCPPGGTVYDPFSGSGTTVAVALRHGRNFIGTDIRESQVDLTGRRIAEVQPVMF